MKNFCQKRYIFDDNLDVKYPFSELLHTVECSIEMLAVETDHITVNQ